MSYRYGEVRGILAINQFFIAKLILENPVQTIPKDILHRPLSLYLDFYNLFPSRDSFLIKFHIHEFFPSIYATWLIALYLGDQVLLLIKQ